MKIRLYIFASLIFLVSFSLNAQNAADYFPSALGYKWFYTTTPHDSLNRPVDSLTFVSVDSFAVNRDFKGRLTKFVLGKNGTKQNVLKSPYLDTGYVSLDSANILNYTGAVPGIDTISIGFLNNINDWYSVYRLKQALNSSYTIFTRDTVVNFNGLNTTFTTEVKVKRIADQQITTPIGDFLCKKFVVTFDIKATIIIIPFTLLAINDTVYLAPGNYLVRDVRPSSNVDLSALGQMAFYIPGSTRNILAPPSILSSDYQNFLVNNNAGDSLLNVFNSGSGNLNWKANVTSGNSWLHLKDSLGNGNGVIRFSFTQNTDNSLRQGSITVSDSNAWDSPKVITVSQEGKLTSLEDKNKTSLEFNLCQNYPNPFNPNTIIKYSVPKDAFVSLTVYNLLGQKVGNLVNESKKAGDYEIQFDASHLPSGIYFYRLDAGLFSSVKKMILMK